MDLKKIEEEEEEVEEHTTLNIAYTVIERVYIKCTKGLADSMVFQFSLLFSVFCCFVSKKFNIFEITRSFRPKKKPFVQCMNLRAYNRPLKCRSLALSLSISNSCVYWLTICKFPEVSTLINVIFDFIIYQLLNFFLLLCRRNSLEIYSCSFSCVSKAHHFRSKRKVHENLTNSYRK